LEELLQVNHPRRRNELQLQVEGMELEYKIRIAAKDGEIAAETGDRGEDYKVGEDEGGKGAAAGADTDRVQEHPVHILRLYRQHERPARETREFGHNNLTRRCQQRFKTFVNFRLVNAFRVENKQLVENDKNHAVLNKLRRLLVGEVNQLEILAIGGITITELDKHIRDIIVSNGSRPKTLALVKGTSDWLSTICC
jgi:hypothetical protein